MLKNIDQNLQQRLQMSCFIHNAKDTQFTVTKEERNQKNIHS